MALDITTNKETDRQTNTVEEQKTDTQTRIQRGARVSGASRREGGEEEAIREA